MRLFPLFADLRGRDVLVVGGGAVAVRKVRALREAGASIRVGAPELEPALQAMVAQGDIHWLPGTFTPDWLAEAWLVIAATDQEDVNQAVAAAAGAQRLWANVVDDPARSSVQVPSVVDRAPLVVAISSGGAAPVLARRLRERIESLFDQSLGTLAGLAQEHREAIRQRFPDMTARRDFYDWLHDGPVLAALRAGQPEQAQAELQAALDGPRPVRRGRVLLVGVGPGPASDLTLGGLRAVNEADVILYDAAVTPEVLALARRDADVLPLSGAAQAALLAPSAAGANPAADALLMHLAALAAAGQCVVLLSAGAGWWPWPAPSTRTELAAVDWWQVRGVADAAPAC